jgi:hypothetical protein
MTREDERANEPTRDAEDSKPDDAMSALLKRSLDPKAAEPPAPKDFLRGVQKRIRTRSRGRFYADGWSTSSSRVSYILVAGAMLIVIAVAYFALGPMGISAY